MFAFKSKVKTVAEKLSFTLRTLPGNLRMDILRDSQLVIFSPSTIFITFPTVVLQVFFSNSRKVWGGENWKRIWIFALTAERWRIVRVHVIALGVLVTDRACI